VLVVDQELVSNSRNQTAEAKEPGDITPFHHVRTWRSYRLRIGLAKRFNSSDEEPRWLVHCRWNGLLNTARDGQQSIDLASVLRLYVLHDARTIAIDVPDGIPSSGSYHRGHATPHVESSRKIGRLAHRMQPRPAKLTQSILAFQNRVVGPRIFFQPGSSHILSLSYYWVSTRWS
jgi:hypothetical protein